jgi:repressor LexA
MDPRIKLTAKQRAIHDFIRGFLVEHGKAPSVREIAKQFGIRSPNGVLSHLKALERKGLIVREAGEARAIQLANPLPPVKLPIIHRVTAETNLASSAIADEADFSLLFQADSLFCLRVYGEPLAAARMQDGDYVIFRPSSEANDGDVVLIASGGKSDPAQVGRVRRGTAGLLVELLDAARTVPDLNQARILAVAVGVVRRF